MNSTYEEGARTILQDGKPVILLFGTAWGLDRNLMKLVDYILDPVSGAEDYNHLSVRTAAAIIIDRLAGSQESI